MKKDKDFQVIINWEVKLGKDLMSIIVKDKKGGDYMILRKKNFDQFIEELMIMRCLKISKDKKKSI